MHAICKNDVSELLFVYYECDYYGCHGNVFFFCMYKPALELVLSSLIPNHIEFSSMQSTQRNCFVEQHLTDAMNEAFSRIQIVNARER